MLKKSNSRLVNRLLPNPRADPASPLATNPFSAVYSPITGVHRHKCPRPALTSPPRQTRVTEQNFVLPGVHAEVVKDICNTQLTLSVNSDDGQLPQSTLWRSAECQSTNASPPHEPVKGVLKQRPLPYKSPSHVHLLSTTQYTLASASGPYGARHQQINDPLLETPALQLWSLMVVVTVAQQPLAGVDGTLPALAPAPKPFFRTRSSSARSTSQTVDFSTDLPSRRQYRCDGSWRRPAHHYFEWRRSDALRIRQM